jgi:hypothetical protein
MQTYVITTISTLVNRYAIEADSKECAVKEWNRLDEGHYPEELSCCKIARLHIGEEISNVMEVNHNNLIEMCDSDVEENVLDYVRKAPYQDNRGFVE